MEVTERADGVLVINDAYNANPESMRSALTALAAIVRTAPGPGWPVVRGARPDGRARPGRARPSTTRSAGWPCASASHGSSPSATRPARSSTARLWKARGTASRAGCPTSTPRSQLLRAELRPADVVLVKASRAARLERVALAIADDARTDSPTRGGRRTGERRRMKTILIAAVFSLLTSILCTPLVVVYFRRRGFGQEIRVDGPQTHLVKRGTPTMGGVAIIGSTVLGYVVAHVIIAIRGGGGPNASGLLALFLMVGLGGVGFLDDFIKIRRQRSLGLRARAKFAGQLVVARRVRRCWRCSCRTSTG